MLILLLLSLLSIAPAKAAPVIPKMALVQYNADASFGSVAKHIQELEQIADSALSKGAKFIVFPEGAMAGYGNRDQLWCSPELKRCENHRCRDVSQVAEAIAANSEGQIFLHWQNYARLHKIYLTFNVPEKSGSVFYNTTVVMGPSGYLAKYRKRELYYMDTCYAQPGQDSLMLNTPYGKFGFLTCADANHEDWFVDYKKQGADAVVVTMDWDQDPRGFGGSRSANSFFSSLAYASGIDIYASDSAPWDGTGKYLASGANRLRFPLPAEAIDQVGFSLLDF